LLRDVVDALDFLKDIHHKLKRLFDRAERTHRFSVKKAIFKQIKRDLAVHARIEEGILFPAIESHEQVKHIVIESYKTHKHVDLLLRGIDGLVSENKPVDPELTILRETVCQANEQEEKTIFPQIRELLDDQNRKDIGRQFEIAIDG